jgi:rhodanese-related sulfurtransferase
MIAYHPRVKITVETRKEIIILDIRNYEEVEICGKMQNSFHVPFDECFASKLMMLDKKIRNNGFKSDLYK